MPPHRSHHLPAAVVFAILALGCHTEQPTTGLQRENPHTLVFLPQTKLQTQLLPVILVLNGAGQRGNDGLRQISNNFGQDIWRRRGQIPFLIVAPQCSEVGSWEPGSPDAERALAALDAAVEKYGGDPQGVYVTGCSAGGSGALEFASAYPDRFAAVLPVSTGDSGDPAKLAEANMPIWCFFNRGDRKQLVESGRASREEWLRAGLSPLVTECQRRGHNAWDEAYGPPIVYPWLLQQSLGRNQEQEPFQLLSARQVLDNWRRHGQAIWTINEQGELTGPANKHRGVLLSPAAIGETEWHLDVFMKTPQRLRLGILPRDAMPDEITEIILELPWYGTGGVRSPNGQWLATLDPAAQRSLNGGWNDVRLARRGERITLHLNGWPALDFADPTGGEPLRWALFAGTHEPVRVRYLRRRGGFVQPVEAIKP